MNKERVELFLAALESGEYTQCTGQLRALSEDGVEYNCALGVATHVALDNGLRAEMEARYTPGPVLMIIDSMFRGGALPGVVAEWYGFGNTDPILTEPAGPYQLVTCVTRLNDSGKDFWTIAQMGREQWLKDQG